MTFFIDSGDKSIRGECWLTRRSRGPSGATSASDSEVVSEVALYLIDVATFDVASGDQRQEHFPYVSADVRPLDTPEAIHATKLTLSRSLTRA